MERLLNHASKSNQKLEMIYIDSEENVSQRVIRVVKVQRDHVVAYCYARKQVRSFKLSNILSVFPHQKKGAYVSNG